jgi:hypothetical protein
MRCCDSFLTRVLSAPVCDGASAIGDDPASQRLVSKYVETSLPPAAAVCVLHLDDRFSVSSRSWHEFAPRLLHIPRDPASATAARTTDRFLPFQCSRSLVKPASDRSSRLLRHVHQFVFFGCSSLGIEHGDLLKARVKITTYYDHPDSFLTLTLVSKPDTVYGLH